MIKYVEYLETNGTEAGWNLNEGLTASTDILYFDFMPLSGSMNYDAFWVFIDASADGPSVRCSVTNRTILQFGTSEMNYANKIINLGERYNCVFGSAITVNNEVVKASSSNGGGAIYVNCWAWGTANNNYRSQRARYYGLKITDSNGNVLREWKPCENTTNNTVGFHETVTDTYIAQIGSGTTTIGPYLSTISVDSDIKAVPASGGTINVTISTDTPWSATSTGSWYTMSQTEGTENDTAITITVPSTTAATQAEDTITFTNENGDTDQLTIKQRKYSVGGIRLIDIGESEVETFYIGNDEVELIYMGEEIVYQKGQGPTPTPTPTQPQAAFLWTNDGEIHVTREVDSEIVFPTLSNGVDYYMVNTTDDLDEITTEKDIFGLVDEDDGFYLDIYKKIDGWKILYDSGNGDVEESCGLAIGETISIQDFGLEFEVIENGFVFNFTSNIFETIGFCEIYGENDGDEIEQNNVRFVYVDDGENTPHWDAVGCEYVCKACFEMVNGNIGERTVNKSDCPYLVNDRGYGVIFYISYWGGGNEQIALMNVTDDYYGKALYLNANKSIKFGDTTINQGTVNASVGNYYVSNKKNSTEEWIEILPSNGNSRLTISNLY